MKIINNTMPSLGLILTSIGFFIPAIIAKKRKQKVDTILISSLATSSIFYHGTLHRTAHVTDLIVAHSVAINYLILGIKNVLKHSKKLDMLGLFFGGLSTHMYYRKSLRIHDEKISRKWHMKVHLSAQMALIAFILGSSKPPKEPFDEYELEIEKEKENKKALL